MVIGGSGSTVKEWEELDSQMNRYPMYRQFSAIGSGGPSFRESMVAAVEASTGQSVRIDDVTETPSSGGKYTSVRINVVVQSPEQVKSVFDKIKSDPRLKWCM